MAGDGAVRRAGWSGCWRLWASRPGKSWEDVDRVVGEWAAQGIAAPVRRSVFRLAEVEGHLVVNGVFRSGRNPSAYSGVA